MFKRILQGVLAASSIFILSGQASATCMETVSALQSINCSIYPPSTAAFCRTYKPYLMNYSDCRTAESYARSKDTGPERERCERESFDHASGSWSYVFACSWLDRPEENQPPDDPACYQRLKERGLQFAELGNVSNGYEPHTGQHCLIKNAVRTGGGALKFPTVDMNCRLAEAVEDFGEQLAAMGVVRLEHHGTASCRRVYNADGWHDKLSNHSLGEAFDVHTFIFSDGTKLKASKWNSGTEEEKSLLRKIHDIACDSFPGVLGHDFYRGQQDHFHFEHSSGRFCRE